MATSATSPQRPAKRRRKVVAMLARLATGLLVLAVGGWLVADLVYGRLLTARLAELRRAGVPLTMEEVLGPEPPAAQNAAGIYVPLLHIDLSGSTSASKGVGRLTNGQVLEVLDRYCLAPDDPRNAMAARRLLATPAAREALAALREASGRPYCSFRQPSNADPASRSMLPAEFRYASWLVLAKALAEARSGSLREAADWLAVNMRMARHAGQNPAQMSYLVMVVLYARTGGAAADILRSRVLPRRGHLAAAGGALRSRRPHSPLPGPAGRQGHGAGTHGPPGPGSHAAGDGRRVPGGTRPREGNARPASVAAAGVVLSRPRGRCSTPRAAPLRALRQTYRAARTRPLRRSEGVCPALSTSPWGAPSATCWHTPACLRSLWRSTTSVVSTAPIRRAWLTSGSRCRQTLSAAGDFVYRRRGADYLLYSVGENGKDDGGRRPGRVVAWDQADLVWGRSSD